MTRWRDRRGKPIDVIILDSLAPMCLASQWRRALFFAKRDARVDAERDTQD
jgi:hypothetical protein